MAKNKKIENQNLLQEIFDLIWYKIFPEQKLTFTKEEALRIFPTLPSLIKYKIPKKIKKEGIYITIGESFNNKNIILNLKENPHTYIVGATGSGKSVMTKVILTTLINNYNDKELEIYLADLKRVELNLFRKVKQCKEFVYTVEDTTRLIAQLLEETNRRYDLFMQHEVTNIFEYNKLPNTKKLKYQVLYIEEIVMLLEDKKKTAMKLLKQLIAISRAAGLYVFLTTQRPDCNVIDSVVKANINNRICFKVEDRKNSIVALDAEGAELLKGKGHGIIKRGCEKEEFRGYFIDDKQVKDIIKPYLRPKKDILPSNANKGTLENKQVLNDVLVKEENKTHNNANDKVKNFSDLKFLDNL